MIEKAIRELSSGKPVLIHDSLSRENETDIVMPSQFVTADTIRFMRKNGGGLICVTIREAEAKAFGLDYIDRLLDLKDRSLLYSGDVRYDQMSPFSIWINSRDTFTGISDNDRAATVRHLATFISSAKEYNGNAPSEFARKFRTPGHVPLIIAREGYFSRRRGHTELSTYLLEKAGLIRSATIVEMLGDDGRSMQPEEARNFAESHSLTFIEGSEIIDSWSNETRNGNGGL